MNQLAIDFSAPREVGRLAADACLDRAERNGFDGEGAGKFMTSWVVRNGPTSGEDLVDAAMAHGYRGTDMRCFGGVFQSLVAKGKLVVLRSDLSRKRGHGTSGGRLYGIPA